MDLMSLRAFDGCLFERTFEVEIKRTAQFERKYALKMVGFCRRHHTRIFDKKTAFQTKE